jgi:hypothetical protein
LDFLLDALFVLADLADADFVDLLADLTLDAFVLADLVLLVAFDLDFFLLPLASVSAEPPDFLLPFFDASTTISSFLVALFFFSDPFTLRAFVDFLD